MQSNSKFAKRNAKTLIYIILFLNFLSDIVYNSCIYCEIPLIFSLLDIYLQLKLQSRL